MVSFVKCTLCQIWLLYFLCYNFLLVESSALYEEISDSGPLTEADLEYVSKLFQRAMENRRSSRLATPVVILDPNSKQISQIRSRLRLPIIGKRVWMIKRQGFKPCVFKYCDF